MSARGDEFNKAGLTGRLLYSRANKLFSLLAIAEQIVVLLDEFDEMGRDRSASPDILSRFITTAMLPKLAAINDERKIVFLLATNYVSQFDAAFSRGGRFDMIIQVMPPNLDAKLARTEWHDTLTSIFEGLNAKKTAEARSILGDLTFLETEQLVARLQSDVEDPFEEIKAAGERGAMARKVGEKTWKQLCTDEEKLIRLPNTASASISEAGTAQRPKKTTSGRNTRSNDEPK